MLQKCNQPCNRTASFCGLDFIGTIYLLHPLPHINQPIGKRPYGAGFKTFTVIPDLNKQLRFMNR